MANPNSAEQLVLTGRPSDLMQLSREVKILGICGSLRRTSANAGLLRAAQQVMVQQAA